MGIDALFQEITISSSGKSSPMMIRFEVQKDCRTQTAHIVPFSCGLLDKAEVIALSWI